MSLISCISTVENGTGKPIPYNRNRRGGYYLPASLTGETAAQTSPRACSVCVEHSRKPTESLPSPHTFFRSLIKQALAKAYR
ncbi:MAG: hypothetical protein FWG65_00145 [Turicibacter sp.]|nr:hypothetical protein [Turicibacter sp.]